MSSNITQLKSNSCNMYRLRLEGALNSPTIDWLGDITIIPQEHGEMLQVCLLVDPAGLRSFLDQFHNLNITVLPNECIKIENPQLLMPENVAEREL
jgi:hypothetical protein